MSCGSISGSANRRPGRHEYGLSFFVCRRRAAHPPSKKRLEFDYLLAMNSGTVKHITAAIILVLCGASSAISGPERPQHARLSLISEHSSAAPGSTQWIGLRFQLDPGWHIYWTNPADSGAPPKATWHLPNRVQAGDLQFPIPQRIQDHGLTDYGYQSDVVLLSKIQIPDTGMSGNIEIAADVRYLVCGDVCV